MVSVGDMKVMTALSSLFTHEWTKWVHLTFGRTENLRDYPPQLIAHSRNDFLCRLVSASGIGRSGLPVSDQAADSCPAAVWCTQLPNQDSASSVRSRTYIAVGTTVRFSRSKHDQTATYTFRRLPHLQFLLVVVYDLIDILHRKDSLIPSRCVYEVDRLLVLFAILQPSLRTQRALAPNCSCCRERLTTHLAISFRDYASQVIVVRS